MAASTTSFSSTSFRRLLLSIGMESPTCRNPTKKLLPLSNRTTTKPERLFRKSRRISRVIQEFPIALWALVSTKGNDRSRSKYPKFPFRRIPAPSPNHRPDVHLLHVPWIDRHPFLLVVKFETILNARFYSRSRRFPLLDWLSDLKFRSWAWPLYFVLTGFSITTSFLATTWPIEALNLGRAC